MDPKTIQQQDIAARYLTGDLTVREAREFEKYCLQHPDVTETLPIPVRLKARLAHRRLTEEEAEQELLAATLLAQGSREPAEPDLLIDDDRPRIGFQVDRPFVLYSLVGALVLALAGVAIFAMRSGELSDQVRAVERHARSVALRAPSSLQAYRVVPDPSGPPANAQLAMRWPDPPQLLELRIDVSKGRYTAFTVTIDKVDEARIMQIRRVASDSNRELRIGLNSSAFGPGTYDLQIEGYTLRGDLAPYGWVRIQLVQ